MTTKHEAQIDLASFSVQSLELFEWWQFVHALRAVWLDLREVRGND